MNGYESSVRIGPISLFTFIAVLCLATLAVLSITTAKASQNMAVLHGESVIQQYQADAAAQRFVAMADEQQGAAGSGDARATALVAAFERSGQDIVADYEGVEAIEVYAEGPIVYADFVCSNERELNIAIAFSGDGSYKITKWNMTAKRNTAEAENLWSGI